MVKTVDNYIQGFPESMQPKLQEMRELILAAAPDATEGMKWNQPAYTQEVILVMFGGFKHHIGLYVTPSTLQAFANELSDYKTGNGTIQFPYSKPLPEGLITSIVAYRVREYKEHGVKWINRQ